MSSEQCFSLNTRTKSNMRLGHEYSASKSVLVGILIEQRNISSVLCFRFSVVLLVSFRKHLLLIFQIFTLQYFQQIAVCLVTKEGLKNHSTQKETDKEFTLKVVKISYMM